MMNNFAPPPSLADMRRAISGPVVVISKSERIASFVRSEVKRSQSGGLPKREKSSIVSLSRMMLGRHKCNKSYESKQEEDAGLGDTSKRQQTYREEVESVKVYPKDFVKQHDAAITKYYFIKELLGEGGFAEVWRGVCKETGTERAVKIIEKTMLTESEYEHVVAEVDIMKDLDHPSINRIHHFFHDDVEFCIVQDLSKGGDLYDEVADTGRISEEDTATIMKELLSCVNYLHEEKAIVHRDINLGMFLNGCSNRCALFGFQEKKN